MLSALSGTPSLALPLGHTESGIPVGIDLLGKTLSDHKLLAIGYAIEQKINARFPPLATPALVNGQTPIAPSFTIRIDDMVKIEFVFDITKSTLEYKLQYLTNDEVYAICLHRFKNGPLIQCLSRGKRDHLSGTLLLNYKHIDELKRGDLYLRVFSPSSPLGEQNKQMKLL